MVRAPHELRVQLNLLIVSATRPVGLVSGLDKSHLRPASRQPALLVTMNPLRAVVTSAQMRAKTLVLASAPQASGVVQIGIDLVSGQRNLRRRNCAKPDLYAPREGHPLRKLLARAGASR